MENYLLIYRSLISFCWMTIFIVFFCFLTNAQPLNGKIGVNIEDAFESANGKVWVDATRGAMPANIVGQYGNPTLLDANGYPLTDAEVYFVNQFIMAEWTGFVDDPQARRINISGTYKLSFKGQADLSGFENIVFANKIYNSATNITTADVVVGNNSRIIAITFTNTRRTPQSPTNSGITDYKLILPNYSTNTNQIFTNELLNALKPFRAIRFLNWSDTNNNDPIFPQVVTWNDRHLPNSGTQQKIGKKFGVSWEYAILLCNETNKDLWINIPASATEDYVRQLSLLIRDGNSFTNGKGLKPHLKIYLEHSNEIWNDGFTQQTYNRAATQAEVSAGNSPLNNDGETNINELSRRRHAKRSREILQIFALTFGATEINNRIRGVYAHDIGRVAEIQRVLNWLNSTYGQPKNYFYAVAINPYFTWFGAFGGTVPQILQSFRNQASTDAAQYTTNLIPILRNFGLKLTAYEGGTISADFAPFGQASVVGNGILAERDSQMRDILKFAIKEKWFDLDRDVMDLYNYFTLSSDYGRFGCYGLVEDFTNLTTSKYLAMTDLLGNGENLPEGWISEDIGNGLSGSATFNNEVFTLHGGGNGLWDTQDDFHYVYQFLGVRPNITLTTKVSGLTLSNPQTKAGLMIRNSFANNTSYSSISLNAGGNVSFQSRVFTGQSLQSTDFSSKQATVWLRLEKKQNALTAYFSENGTNWTKIGQTKIVIGAKVTVGLFVSSQNRNQISQAVFDNVVIR